MDSREGMIEKIKGVYGLDAPKVFSAMRKVPREEFVPEEYRDSAYEDGPISIGFGQTISQPYTVAFMTHLLFTVEKSHFAKTSRDWKVLEIGTGSGYQAAILSHLAKKVYTIEIVPELADKARETLKKLGHKNVEVRLGSGEWGWKEKAPFDAIIVTAGVEKVPQELLSELKDGGVLVAPVGKGPDKAMTKFTRIKKQGKEEIKKNEYGIFHFVPFVDEKD